MILSDYSAIAISAITGSAFREKLTLDDNLVKHIVFSTFRNIHTALAKDYGDHLLLLDHRSWRKDKFEFYKANRDKTKKASSIDWDMIFRIMDECAVAFDEHFPWWVIKEPGCEADDLIAAFAKTATEPCVIVSKDHDFHQLLNDNIHQYNFSKRKFFQNVDPEDVLIEQIIRGDKGDGVPNVMSDDDSFVNSNKRQAQITKKRLKMLKEYAKNEFKDAPKDLKRNWDRNKLMIQLIDPIEIAVKATDKYYCNKDMSVIQNDTANYFAKNKMVVLIGKIADFYIKKGEGNGTTTKRVRRSGSSSKSNTADSGREVQGWNLKEFIRS